MAALAAEAVRVPEVQAGPAPVVLGWPLAGCRPDSLADLFSPRALAELARVAGPAGGAAVLELGGRTLQAPAGGRPGALQLLEDWDPPAGLSSLALRNGTLALRAGFGVAVCSTLPFAVSLEQVKITRPAPVSSAGASSRAALELGVGNIATVSFVGAGDAWCSAGWSCPRPAQRATADSRPASAYAQEDARVVLEDVDVVARQGACSSLTAACAVTTGARLELIRCARGEIFPPTNTTPESKHPHSSEC
jgi:hypothetical protein